MAIQMAMGMGMGMGMQVEMRMAMVNYNQRSRIRLEQAICTRTMLWRTMTASTRVDSSTVATLGHIHSIQMRMRMRPGRP